MSVLLLGTACSPFFIEWYTSKKVRRKKCEARAKVRRKKCNIKAKVPRKKCKIKAKVPRKKCNINLKVHRKKCKIKVRNAINTEKGGNYGKDDL